jgi:RNA polymerase sigma factor (sigma-70 family)
MTELEQHFRKNYNKLVNQAIRLLGNRADAEEAVMDAYREAWQYRDTYKNLSAVFGNVLSSSVKRKRKDIRRQGMTSGTEQEMEEVADETCIEEVVDENIKHQKTLDLLKTKKPDHQTVLKLHYIYGKDPRDIEKVVKFPNNTIRRILTRFRQELKDNDLL